MEYLDVFVTGYKKMEVDQDLPSAALCSPNCACQLSLLPTSQAFWKTRRPDEAADYRAVRRFVCAEKISQTLQNVEM